jgi:hypothetical protein
VESFDNHVKSYLEALARQDHESKGKVYANIKKAFDHVYDEIKVIGEAMGGERGEPDADGITTVTIPSLGDQVRALEKNIQFIAKVLGGEPDADGNMILPKLDALIDRHVEKILSERAERGSNVAKTVKMIDQILTH